MNQTAYVKLFKSIVSSGASESQMNNGAIQISAPGGSPGPTNTPLPPTNTPTNTPVPSTNTPTVTPTSTPVPSSTPSTSTLRSDTFARTNSTSGWGTASHGNT